MPAGGADWRLKLRLMLLNKKRVLEEYSKHMDAAIAKAKLPYAARRWDLTPPQDPVIQLLALDFGYLNWMFPRSEAQNRLLLGALALHAYHKENGRHPQQLTQLVPRYLKRLPDDPFALRQPLRYKLQPVKYIKGLVPPAPGAAATSAPPVSGAAQPLYATIPYCLYSVGVDSKDNGGRAIENPTELSPQRRYWVQENAQGDIVAGINR
jgi:hypothetical protein